MMSPQISQPSWTARVNYTRQQPLDRDAELMLLVRDGDQRSFELLLEKHRGPMIHFLRRMVQNEAVAEELAQEVFLRVYKSRGNYEPCAKFTTCRTVEQELLYEARLGEVRQAIYSLPAKQRAAVMMHKYEEMEYAQIASAIGCSESAVKSLLFRAYEALRVRLAHMA